MLNLGNNFSILRLLRTFALYQFVLPCACHSYLSSVHFFYYYSYEMTKTDFIWACPALVETYGGVWCQMRSPQRALNSGRLYAKLRALVWVQLSHLHSFVLKIRWELDSRVYKVKCGSGNKELISLSRGGIHVKNIPVSITVFLDCFICFPVLPFHFSFLKVASSLPHTCQVSQPIRLLCSWASSDMKDSVTCLAFSPWCSLVDFAESSLGLVFWLHFILNKCNWIITTCVQ